MEQEIRNGVESLFNFLNTQVNSLNDGNDGNTNNDFRIYTFRNDGGVTATESTSQENDPVTSIFNLMETLRNASNNLPGEGNPGVNGETTRRTHHDGCLLYTSRCV